MAFEYVDGPGQDSWLDSPSSYEWGDQPDYSAAPVYQETAHREIGTRRYGRIARAAGAVVTVVGLAAGAFTVIGGHGDARPSEKSPRPAAAGSVHPGGAHDVTEESNVLSGGVIDLGSALRDSEIVPQPVIADEASVVMIEGFDVRKAGDGYFTNGYGGTGYVATDADGGSRLFSAAHVLDPTDGSGSVKYPYFVANTRVDGQLREDRITAIQRPNAYDAATNLDLYGTSVDLAEAIVAPDVWADQAGTAHSGVTGFDSIPAIPEASQMPKPGTVVYQAGFAKPDGDILKPPHKPIIEASVVAGYVDNGNKVILIPLDQWRTRIQRKGNSGGPIMDSRGDVFATNFEGAEVSANYLEAIAGIRVIGGDGASVNQEDIELEAATVNNPSILRTVGNAALRRVSVTNIYP